MDPHLDAEQLAAFADGSLSRAERVAVEAHAADCARCLQLLAAMARTDVAASPSHQRAAKQGWRLPGIVRWGVPLAAGATALALWINVAQEQQDDRVAAPATTVSPPAPAAPAASPETVREPPRPTPSESTAADAARSKDMRKEAGQPVDTRLADKAQERADLRARAEARAPKMGQAQLPAAQEAVALAVDVVSPDPLRRWRVAGTVVQRSTDGGQTWIAQAAPVQGELLAGSSPSPDVAWLVGRAGTVLVTTDGSRWQRVDFPQPIDLIAVRASSGRQVEVTTADGRVFRTSDGGRTWSLQESPATSF